MVEDAPRGAQRAAVQMRDAALFAQFSGQDPAAMLVPPVKLT
jgi:hypothetical protein